MVYLPYKTYRFYITYLMKVLLIVSLVVVAVVTQVSPTWSADPNFRAGTYVILATLTVSPFDNSYSFTFASATTSNPPQFTYGLKGYDGNDYIVNQSFMLTLTSWSNTGAIIALHMQGYTMPQLMEISYLLIQTTVNYNIHLYNHMDINYTTTLANVTIPTASPTLQTHTEVVNFATNQLYSSYNSLNYQSFSTPLSDNKILFFLTAAYILGANADPINLALSYTILDSSSYQMALTVGYNVSVTRFTFGQIIYNIANYTSDVSPYLYGLEWVVSDSNLNTSLFNVGTTIVTNQLIFGLKTFTTTFGSTSLAYLGQFGTFSGNQGIHLLPSVPINTTNSGISTSVSSLFMMLVFTCPPYYYFDINTRTCLPCTNTLCYSCSSTNTTICLSCGPNFVASGTTCVCDASASTKFLANVSNCFICSDKQPNCQTCSYTGTSSIAYDAASFRCITCNNTAGYFIDATDQCSLCTLANCITCLGLAECSVCDVGFGVKATGSCSTCPVTACTTCLNLTYCSVCDTNFTLTSSTGACQSCSQTCLCGGYALPKKANGDCSTDCGDGQIMAPQEQCDDGNAINGDGCSSTCLIEAFSSCGGAPSSCFLNSNIYVQLVSTIVSTDTCNTITFQFQMFPTLQIFQMYQSDWSSFVTTSDPAVSLQPSSTSYNSGLVSVTYTFSQTIQNKQINFAINPVGIVNSTYLSTVSASNVAVNVQPNNNIAAVYCDDAVCNLRKSTSIFTTFQTTVAYIGLFLSLFSLKINGLQMFGLLQLSFFILSDYDFINLLFIGMLGKRQVNGININSGAIGSPSISSRVVINGYTSQVFLQNYNVMFYITLALCIAGIIMYSITFFINKQAQGENLSASLKQDEGQSSLANNKDESEEPKSQKWHRWSKYLLKQILMTFIIFSMFNIGFSAGLQMKYINQVDAWAILCMLFSFSIIISLIIAQVLTDKLQFGEYKDKFKKRKLPANYITATIFYRFTLGLLMALLNEWRNSGIIFILLSGAFLTYIFAFQPFNQPIHNTRSKVVHSAHVLVLIVYHFYRSEANYDEVSSSSFLFPAYIQVITVGIIVFLSTALLAYEFYNVIKLKFCGGSEVNEENLQTKEEILDNSLQVKERQKIQVQNLDQ